MTYLLLLSLGLCSGLLGGMLGIGGGVVIVPALILFFESTNMHEPTEITVIAVATSMACIVFTSLSAAYAQHRARRILWPVMTKMLPFFILGSLTASLLAPLVPAIALRMLIGLFLFCVALIMLTQWKPEARRTQPGMLGSSAVGLSGGMVSGIAGIAGGNVIVPTLIFFNTPVHNATGTSSAMGVPIAMAGALGYFAGEPTIASDMLGFVHIPSWLLITCGAVVAAPFGVRIAHKVPADKLKKLFGIFLALAATRMLYTSFIL